MMGNEALYFNIFIEHRVEWLELPAEEGQASPPPLLPDCGESPSLYLYEARREKQVRADVSASLPGMESNPAAY